MTKKGCHPDGWSNTGFRAFVLLLAAILVVAQISTWDFVTDDFRYYFDGWIFEIRQRGTKSWNSGAFTNYSPPNIYSLWLSVMFMSPLTISNLVALKFSALLGQLVLGGSGYYFFRAFGKSRRLAIILAFVTVFLPTLFLNSIVWGQSDVWYLAFLIFSVGAIQRKNLGLSVVFFVAAFTWKAQTLFYAPIFSAIWLVELYREHGTHFSKLAANLYQIFRYAAGTFILVCLPAWIQGMSLSGVFGIYFGQKDAYTQLSMNAPNFWSMFPGLPYHPWMLRGFALGVFISAMIFGAYLIRRPRRESLLDWITATAVLIPFVLPKMHERYFIFAEFLVFSRFLMKPNLGTGAAALLLQLITLRTYAAYLFAWPSPPFAVLAPVLGMVGVALMRSAYRERGEFTLPSSSGS